MRVEVLLAGTTEPEPLSAKDLVEADLWSQLPADVPELLELVPRADLYIIPCQLLRRIADDLPSHRASHSVYPCLCSDFLRLKKAVGRM